MTTLDRTAARALVEAGYMPLSHYIEMFGDSDHDSGEFAEASLIPDVTEDIARIGPKERVSDR